ncbi:MAG TPA: DUF2339 domain-containing protein [Povalibacter sp.]|uniref:DUF2339 domain-containing protein n=1 Tax=Povalibacter sp. TaxID=1962978 RepID=UPI002BB55D2C|nr:DUF2339 domain-containing protein [Povalibacter sp.]HMN46302.1 DUF2339 domain-containing protein [Povalibacter sp.]
MQADKEPSSTGMTWALAILFAVIGAGIQENAGGFIIGAMLGVLLAQVLHLRALAKIHRDLIDSLRQSPPPSRPEQPAAEPARPRTTEPYRAPVFDRTPDTSIPSAPAAPMSTVAAAPAPVVAAPAAPRLPPLPRKPPEPSFIESRIDDFIRWFKGGNPLARIGIVILFFGAAFLAKYAAENSLFPIELRFIALAVGAFALLIVGWRLKDKRPVYAQLLQGGGIAGLYLTVFAASRLYHLLPLGLAFGLLVVIAVTAGVIAVAQNSLSLAVIGTAGGFLAPIMVSTGSGNHIALFTYYAILNLGVFTVAWFRTWRALNVLGFLFTFTITSLWRASGYESHDLFSADAFLILFFLQYVAVSILNCVRQPPDLKGYVSGSLVFGLPVVAFTLHATLVAKFEYALAWSALALGTFYLALGWSLWRSRRESFRLLVEAFAALGVIFASLAIPLAFDTRTTAAMWAVEGAGLFWLGMRQQRKLARAFGALLQVAAGAGFLIGLPDYHGTQPLLNSLTLGAVMLAVSGLLTSYWLHRHRETQASYEAGWETGFALWGLVWWLFAGVYEIDRHLSMADTGAMLGYAALTAMLLAWIGIKVRWRLAQTLALSVPAAAVLAGLLYSVDASHPFAHWGESGWITVLAVHYGLLYLHDRGRLDTSAVAASVLHAGAYWVLTLLIAWESSWQIDFHASGVWPLLPWGLAPALMLAFVGRRRLIPAWPVAQFAQTYRVLAAFPLAFATGAWIVFMNLTNAGDAGWLPYLPLLNPLDVGVALCLAALGLWWTSLDDEQQSALWSDDRAPIIVAAVLTFLWLNSALLRSLHHNFGAPLTLRGMAHSTLVQASLSIFWGLLGFTAMTVAARQKWRYVWLVGAALMIVVVAKLFLVDLSSIGTIARIASFLTVGVLLLVTGYLAPLPPRHDGEEVTE